MRIFRHYTMNDKRQCQANLDSRKVLKFQRKIPQVLEPEGVCGADSGSRTHNLLVMSESASMPCNCSVSAFGILLLTDN